MRTPLNLTSTLSYRILAGLAGISILLMAILAFAWFGLLRSQLIVDGDLAATFTKIQANLSLFRIGIFAWLVILLCDVVAATALFLYLRKVNEGISLLAGILRLGYSAILGVAIFSLVLALVGMEQESAISPTTLNIYLSGFEMTWGLGLVIFGFHLLLLGYLVYRAAMPRWIGILLMIAAPGYLLIQSAQFLLPENTVLLAVLQWVFTFPMTVSELALAFWLVGSAMGRREVSSSAPSFA